MSGTKLKQVKIDESKTCRNCENYEELYQCNRPDDPVEYDGDSCRLVSHWSSESNREGWDRMIERMIEALEEMFIFEDDETDRGHIFLANMCPWYERKEEG
mgnify:CR=1 FL=1